MSRHKKAKQQMASKPSFKALCVSWYAGKAPLFQFVLKFCAVMVLLYGLSLTVFCRRIVSASAVGSARLSSAVLSMIGERTHVTDGMIWSQNCAITVLPTCTGVEYSMFFCAMVIAFPSCVARKIPGILIGVTLLFTLNLVRIISLYYIGVHFARFFDTAHEELWGFPPIVASVFLSVMWIGWAQKTALIERDVVAT